MFKDFEDRTEIYFLVGNFHYKLKSVLVYITLYLFKEYIHSNTYRTSTEKVTSTYHAT